MSTKQVTFKPSVEVADEFDRLFSEAKEANPELTKPGFFALMVEKYKQPASPDQVNMSDYISRQQHNEIINSLLDPENSTIDEIKSILELQPSDGGAKIIAEIKATQQRAMMALQTQEPQEQQRPLEANEILFTIPEPHLSILKETTRRLSEHLGTTVTIAALLLDMAVRYECERNEEWFYPHLIRANEFKAITGYTIDQIRAFINQKPK